MDNHSLSQQSGAQTPSESSQTAQEYIVSQLQLEADAREALPYQFDTCTRSLGPLRQSVFACLTCTSPPASPLQQFTPAGVCYSCSISCHGEHNLVELFTKRNFVCDCGTSRFVNGAGCRLHVDPTTGRKVSVEGDKASTGNKYNQNFEGKFCGCGDEYDPQTEKGTMFQCLGLGTVEEGGCGEDWWHPECLMGLTRTNHGLKAMHGAGVGLEPIKEEVEHPAAHADGDSAGRDIDPLPEGFPAEDDFDHIICYKCVEVAPWIKQYAGTDGYLPAVPYQPKEQAVVTVGAPGELTASSDTSRKRKADEDVDLTDSNHSAKKTKAGEQGDKDVMTGDTDDQSSGTSGNGAAPRHAKLPPAPTTRISLFLKEDFREHFCRCPSCFPRLAKFPQLLEEEEAYEPPVSESNPADDEAGSVAGRSVNSGSLLDRGEAALSGVDRVRAIEGVMAYNHLRDKVKTFLQPYAESGQAVGAEDVKAYFAKLRGDEAAMREAAARADGGGVVEGDGRREQGGY